MSEEAAKRIWARTVGKSSAKLVLLFIAAKADHYHNCYLSISELSFNTELNKKTIVNALEYLEKRGFIKADKAKGRKTLFHLIANIRTPTNLGLRGPTNLGTSTKNGTSTNLTHTPKPLRKNFIPPSVEQVRDYCLERNNGIDPEAFINHYKTSGWVRGKTKIKDWKACVRTWEKEQNNDQQKKQSTLERWNDRSWAE